MERPRGIILTAIAVTFLGVLPPAVAVVRMSRRFEQHLPRKTASERRHDRGEEGSRVCGTADAGVSLLP
jgi:hypothetical protein